MSDNKQLQKSVQRALSAMRDQQVAKAVQDMRKDVAGPEERIVGFVCACTGAPFHVRFTRTNPADRFCIAAILRDGQQWPEAQPGTSLPNNKSAPAARFELAEFDMSGWECPWCQADNRTVGFSFVHCQGCNTLVCSGRVSALPLGAKWFVCHDRCGSSGLVGPKLKQVDGQQQNRKRLPRANEQPKLSGTTTPRLSGPRK